MDDSALYLGAITGAMTRGMPSCSMGSQAHRFPDAVQRETLLR
jgi:hypothetical protein